MSSSCHGPGTTDAVGYPNEPTFDGTQPMIQMAMVFQYPLTNVPGKTVVGLNVKFPPGGTAPPHRHGGCSVIGYVIKGPVLNKMNDEPVKLVQTGGGWYEAPGCHHKISANPSDTDEAEILATMIVDTEALEKEGMGALLVIDEEYREIMAKMTADAEAKAAAAGASK